MRQETNKESNNHKLKLSITDKKWMARALVVFFADVAATFIAFFIALIFRFDFQFSSIPSDYLEYYLMLMQITI